MTPKTVERALFIVLTFVSTSSIQCASAVLRRVRRSAASRLFQLSMLPTAINIDEPVKMTGHILKAMCEFLEPVNIEITDKAFNITMQDE
jgi:hypothetical protein